MTYYYKPPRRRRRWRTVLVLLNLILIGGLLLGGLFPEQLALIRARLQQEITAQVPQPLVESVAQIVPTATPRRSDQVQLVEEKVIPNPRSDAVLADLYQDGQVDGVPWPNAGGRTTVLSYTVQGGDTLYGIAARHSVSLDTVLWSNPRLGGASALINVGMGLWIPPVDGVYHPVQASDTLTGIATRYQVPVSHITNYPPNGLTPPFTLPNSGVIVPFGVPFGQSGSPTQASQQPTLRWPVIGTIQRGFDPATHPGLQLSLLSNTPILAAASGTVRAVQLQETSYLVIIAHTETFESRYENLQEPVVETGQAVSAGQLLGQVGVNRVEGVTPYLFFAVFNEGEPVSPLGFLP